MKYILEIRNLSHAYDQATSTIKDLNFALKKGEIVSILGPSGIGKTTLLRIVAGLEDVIDGEIKISDKVVSKKNFLLPPEKRNLGLVVEDRALFPHLNVEKNVMFGISHIQERQLR